MVDHVGIVASDLKRGGDFYRAVLAEIGLRLLVAGLRLGATNNGDPGVRRGRYYCAFLIDSDGNNVEAGVYA